MDRTNHSDKSDIRQTILDELKVAAEKNDYISGEALSNKYNISRAAIWKHINNLKNEKNLELRARAVVEQLKKMGSPYKTTVIKENSQVGGGAYPLYNIPTVVLSLDCTPSSVNEFENKLRSLIPAVIARIKNNRILFDMRTLLEDEVKLMPELICSIPNKDN